MCLMQSIIVIFPNISQNRIKPDLDRQTPVMMAERSDRENMD
jgi:hypothetical protein